MFLFALYSSVFIYEYLERISCQDILKLRIQREPLADPPFHKK